MSCIRSARCEELIAVGLCALPDLSRFHSACLLAPFCEPDDRGSTNGIEGKPGSLCDAPLCAIRKALSGP